MEPATWDDAEPAHAGAREPIAGRGHPGVRRQTSHRVRASVSVVTDGAASLPPGVAHELGITVVAMRVVLGDDSHPDGDLTPDAVVRMVSESPGRVTTAAPSPGEYLEAIDSLDGGPVLLATVSARMSASFEAATTAAGYRTRGSVAVVDTESAAGGQGLVVLEAARAAGDGLGLDAVAATARRVARRVRLVAFLESVEQLARSGRVPGIAARAGRSLGVRAVFEFERGSVRTRRPAHGPARAIDRIASECRSDRRPGHRLHAAVLHAQSPHSAARLESLVRELAATENGGAVGAGRDADVFAAPFSSVMVAHTGPGLAGLAWWWEPPEGN